MFQPEEIAIDAISSIHSHLLNRHILLVHLKLNEPNLNFAIQICYCTRTNNNNFFNKKKPKNISISFAPQPSTFFKALHLEPYICINFIRQNIKAVGNEKLKKQPTLHF